MAAKKGTATNRVPKRKSSRQTRDPAKAAVTPLSQMNLSARTKRELRSRGAKTAGDVFNLVCKPKSRLRKDTLRDANICLNEMGFDLDSPANKIFQYVAHVAREQGLAAGIEGATAAQQKIQAAMREDLEGQLADFKGQFAKRLHHVSVLREALKEATTLTGGFVSGVSLDSATREILRDVAEDKQETRTFSCPVEVISQHWIGFAMRVPMVFTFDRSDLAAAIMVARKGSDSYLDTTVCASALRRNGQVGKLLAQVKAQVRFWATDDPPILVGKVTFPGVNDWDIMELTTAPTPADTGIAGD